MTFNADHCPSCRMFVATHLSYVCSGCGVFNRLLWAEEHVDPERARIMSEAEIRAEYEAADDAPSAATLGVVRKAVRR